MILLLQLMTVFIIDIVKIYLIIQKYQNQVSLKRIDYKKIFGLILQNLQQPLEGWWCSRKKFLI